MLIYFSPRLPPLFPVHWLDHKTLLHSQEESFWVGHSLWSCIVQYSRKQILNSKQGVLIDENHTNIVYRNWCSAVLPFQTFSIANSSIFTIKMTKVTEKSKTATVLFVNVLYNWNQYCNMETMLCFLSPFWQSLSASHTISISHCHCQSSSNTKFCCCSLTGTDLAHRADGFCNMLNALQNKRTIVLIKTKKNM